MYCLQKALSRNLQGKLIQMRCLIQSLRSFSMFQSRLLLIILITLVYGGTYWKPDHTYRQAWLLCLDSSSCQVVVFQGSSCSVASRIVVRRWKPSGIEGKQRWLPKNIFQVLIVRVDCALWHVQGGAKLLRPCVLRHKCRTSYQKGASETLSMSCLLLLNPFSLLCCRGLEYRLTVLFLASCVLPSLAVLALPVYASNHKVGTPLLGLFVVSFVPPSAAVLAPARVRQQRQGRRALTWAVSGVLSAACPGSAGPAGLRQPHKLEWNDAAPADMGMLPLCTPSLWSWPAAPQPLRVVGELPFLVEQQQTVEE